MSNDIYTTKEEQKGYTTMNYIIISTSAKMDQHDDDGGIFQKTSVLILQENIP